MTLTPSIQSRGIPTARPKTFVDPPGTTASAGRRCASEPGRPDSTPGVDISPLTASLTVPSPPRVTTTSTPLSAAARASVAACPRRVVHSTVRSTALRRALTRTSRLRSLVVVALGLTTSNARMGGTVPGGGLGHCRYGAAVTGGNSVVDKPATLLWAVRLLYLEAVGLAGLTAYLVVLDLTSTDV